MKHRPIAIVSILFTAAVAVGCGGQRTVVLEPEVRAGPEQRAHPQRVLALSATCGSVEARCPPEYVEVVDGIVRSSLDFAGFAVVQPDQLRAETRGRHVTHETEESSSSSKTTVDQERFLAPDRHTTVTSESHRRRDKTVTVLDGPGFDDLTVGERRAVLAEAGAEAVLISRIVVGAQVGVWSPDQEVEVMVKLAVGEGGTMAWASRCTASSNDFATVTAALENAARCAVYGGTGN